METEETLRQSINWLDKICYNKEWAEEIRRISSMMHRKCFVIIFFFVVVSEVVFFIPQLLTEALQENSTINNSTSVAFVRELPFAGLFN